MTTHAGIPQDPAEHTAAAPVPRPRAGGPRVARGGFDAVLPAPVEVEPADGPGYRLTAGTVIRTGPEPAVRAVGEYLAGLLRPATGLTLPVTDADPTAATGPAAGITLSLTGTAAGPDGPRGPDQGGPAGEAPERLGAEGYRLTSGTDGVGILADTAAGLFHGVQTLRQLLPAAIDRDTPQDGPWEVPAGRIVDHPRYAYRGAMLDVARHFFPVADVLRFVDHLARYKINHLHLHLTDDQGWRIEIESWPRLTEVGGATEVGGGPGGYYTGADYRRIVAYAVARHITVVPEIDVPGHTNAALTAYGQLAPDGVAPPAYTGEDVGFSSVAVHGDVSYDFLADVLGEVAALTPGPYLHVGGDEAFTLGPAEYATFMNRLQPIVSATGKTVLGWHQLAAADVRHEPGRVIQYWGTATADESVAAAVRAGARLILSPGNRSYLDMKYSERTPLGKDWAGLIDVRAAYDWDPGGHLDGVPGSAVLGVEAPLWTETVDSMSDIEFMTFPRLPAVAELGWSPAERHDWADFAARLAAQAPRWTAAGIVFHRSADVPWTDDAHGATEPPADGRADALPGPRASGDAVTAG
ncbi:beta-N-acetylhexosaminidase [Micromonospora zhanjiangensis]|uniref:beta-N-acetylhexosaminidase n=1 Tax=Micromonospora zhanjiangensis TaxID=1522057 RepID=A0ABV8KQZ5_9ACTN